ncbi:hypothetical protein JI721_13055 [Alicyclobacillus cycloheptanicus]|uniref:Uncharacterized protein n=1 Tax=Alicyclobacillus cycloheptanicus TaxID=1457 RepID=A0ABT9XEI9_9BACL|nr:hypothetical protein [Alicyclobacillus cycloheptanicus]MDQ0188710.1 hypothetical protein [Alicyclobacillus cycloheptanicus]WDM00622.1 hypothetical protein JI721_13055 [Alicyclobacillus cycloheptanicus]
MRFLKWITAIVTCLFALYTALQAMQIASAGAVNQIPQLEGDGGGGMVFALLCFIAGVLCMLKPIIALFCYTLTVLAGVVVGIIYDDPVLWMWAGGALILTGCCYASHRWKKTHRPANKRDVQKSAAHAKA